MFTATWVSNENPLVSELRKLMAEANVGPAWVARKVGVAHTTVSHQIDGKAKRRTTEKPWIPLAIKHLKSYIEQQKLSTSLIKEETRPYDVLTGDDFNDLLRKLDRTVLIQVPTVIGGVPWSEGSAAKQTVNVVQIVGAADYKVIVTEAFGQLRAGTLIAFRSHDYPDTGVYLLFQREDDSDQLLVGWVDGSDPVKIQTGATPIVMAGWRILGKAFALAEGSRDSKLEGRYNFNGLGPISRI